MKASRTTIVLFGVLAIVLGLAVFAPSEELDPVVSEALDRPAVASSVAPVLGALPAQQRPAAAPVRQEAGAPAAGERPRFAARAGETLFGAPRAVPAPPKPVAPPPPPPPPVVVVDPAPVVPFVVVGLMEPQGGQPTAWIAEGTRLHVAVAGDVLDDKWRIDSIDRKRIRLTFLPRATQHSLPVPSETSR